MAPTDSAVAMTSASWSCRSTSGARPSGLADHRVLGDPHPVEGQLGEATGEIDRVHGADRQAGGVGGHDAPG